MKKDKNDLTRGWILKAESDLADVKRTLTSKGPFDTACFHCQQAAEKYLKAFLSWNEKPIPKTHDIEELFFLCKKFDSEFNTLKIVPEELTSYAVEMRYDTEFWPDKHIAENAMKQVETIRNFLFKKIPFAFS